MIGEGFCDGCFTYIMEGRSHSLHIQSRGLGHILFTCILEDGIIDYSYIFWRDGPQIIHIQKEGVVTDSSHTFWKVGQFRHINPGGRGHSLFTYILEGGSHFLHIHHGGQDHRL